MASPRGYPGPWRWKPWEFNVSPRRHGSGDRTSSWAHARSGNIKLKASTRSRLRQGRRSKASAQAGAFAVPPASGTNTHSRSRSTPGLSHDRACMLATEVRSPSRTQRFFNAGRAFSSRTSVRGMSVTRRNERLVNEVKPRNAPRSTSLESKFPPQPRTLDRSSCSRFGYTSANGKRSSSGGFDGLSCNRLEENW
eukprot:scaffold17983_cov48-Prasinocladus_malaysianus.AAC.1